MRTRISFVPAGGEACDTEHATSPDCPRWTIVTTIGAQSGPVYASAEPPGNPSMIATNSAFPPVAFLVIILHRSFMASPT
jgi:hypothetical protein